MAQSAAASARFSAVQVDNRKARLDAAIALFRLEASASGYVVEEVRLRLPIPDVDVMPRIIIAQQSGTTHPTFSRSKHPRFLSCSPSASSIDHPAVPICEQPFSNSTGGKPFEVQTRPIATPDTKPENPPGTSAGFKRTISGSGILHPIPVRVLSSEREFSSSGVNKSSAPQRMRPLSSMPDTPVKESSSGEEKNVQKDRDSGAFWKTVIGNERGKEILRTTESMHRMRHGANEPKFRPPSIKQDTATIAVEAPGKSAVPKSESVKGETHETGEEPQENILHINGHNIPESHVQLLLSSAADISAREKRSASENVTDPRMKSSKMESKKITATPYTTLNRKPRRPKAILVSHGKHVASKGTRYSSDKHHSRPSAVRPFRCHKCPSSFDRDGHLRVHILAVHEKKRPFACQVCDASFGHSSSLLRHARTVHQASPTVGSGRYNLSTRSARKSNDSGTTKSEDLCETVEDNTQKHFRCSVCGQAFHRVALLNRHVATKHPFQSSSPEKCSET